MVEACLKNSLLQYRSVQRDSMMHCHPRIWTPALVRPNYKLNCVWCTVELKVIGNLECWIKFYREKKPRHFFYTIEYPYPPTNSVGTELFYRPASLRNLSGRYNNSIPTIPAQLLAGSSNCFTRVGPELVFLYVYGAPESIPRNEFRQPM